MDKIGLMFKLAELPENKLKAIDLFLEYMANVKTLAQIFRDAQKEESDTQAWFIEVMALYYGATELEQGLSDANS